LRLMVTGLFSSSFFATDTMFENGRTAVATALSPAQVHPVALLLRDSRRPNRRRCDSLIWKIKAVDQDSAAAVPQREAFRHLQKTTTLNLLANEDRANLNVGWRSRSKERPARRYT
jgi:hypothetical protein